MKRNLVMIVFDSCRYDTYLEAKTPFMSRLGDVERCYSFASWTVPSHHVLMMGISPHKSPRGVFASEVYKEDFTRWRDRLNIPDISFKAFVPRLSLPAFLKSQGYRTNALVSMPVLNQTTVLNTHFDRFKLMEKHNDLGAIFSELTFEKDTPSFYLINTGETHYPYTIPGENADDLPRLHGVHGVFKHMDDLVVDREPAVKPRYDMEEFFYADRMLALREKQRKNVEYLDTLFEKLYDVVPPDTHVIVLSDHGECFGEDGYFGHGPIFHEKVFEVFFREGRLR